MAPPPKGESMKHKIGHRVRECIYSISEYIRYKFIRDK